MLTKIISIKELYIQDDDFEFLFTRIRVLLLGKSKFSDEEEYSKNKAILGVVKAIVEAKVLKKFFKLFDEPELLFRYKEFTKFYRTIKSPELLTKDQLRAEFIKHLGVITVYRCSPIETCSGFPYYFDFCTFMNGFEHKTPEQTYHLFAKDKRLPIDSSDYIDMLEETQINGKPLFFQDSIFPRAHRINPNITDGEILTLIGKKIQLYKYGTSYTIPEEIINHLIEIKNFYPHGEKAMEEFKNEIFRFLKEARYFDDCNLFTNKVLEITDTSIPGLPEKFNKPFFVRRLSKDIKKSKSRYGKEEALKGAITPNWQSIQKRSLERVGSASFDVPYQEHLLSMAEKYGWVSLYMSSVFREDLPGGELAHRSGRSYNIHLSVSESEEFALCIGRRYSEDKDSSDYKLAVYTLVMPRYYSLDYGRNELLATIMGREEQWRKRETSQVGWIATWGGEAIPFFGPGDENLIGVPVRDEWIKKITFHPIKKENGEYLAKWEDKEPDIPRELTENPYLVFSQ